MKTGFLFILTLIWIAGNAQFADDFSDGELLSNPTWEGETNKFSASNFNLQSTSSVASDLFYISTPISIIGNAEWEFFVNLKLSTSSANYCDIYLVSDSTRLTSAQNGFFVRIGNTNDEVSLYKLANGIESVLIDGADGQTHNKELRIRVIKENANWELWIDYSGDSMFALESAGTSTGSTIGFFGILVKQSTATFHQKHFFDDIYVGSKRIDTTLASVTNIDWLDKNKLEVTFDANLIDNIQTLFALSNGFGAPINITGFGSNKLTLTFSQDLVNGSYTLAITNLNDVDGNSGNISHNFNLYAYNQPDLGDIVISEIFADPTPSQGLPEAEYVEIFNITSDTISLEECSFSDGGNPALFPKVTIDPLGYLILCKQGNEALFNSFGAVVGLQNFPTLNNDRDELELRTKDGNLIDQVSYTETYYKDELKKLGGYALELTDTSNSCSEEENWRASIAAIGGSPGTENSVLGMQTDYDPPQILKALLSSSNEITIELDEPIIARDATDLTNFELGTSGVNPIEIRNTFPLVYVLKFQTNFTENAYEVTIKKMEDCKGNMAYSSTTRAVKIEAINPGDILINELLFNPNKDGVDFIELYNTSPKYIAFDSLQLGGYYSTGTLSIVTLTDYLFAPSTYVALSTDSLTIRKNYPLTKKQFQVAKIPPMNDDNGIIVLYSKNSVIDSVVYNESQHFELLASTEGVSLERISLQSSSNNPSNWTSASSSVGFATPGYQNSHYLDNSSSNGMFKLETKEFSPDGDGYQDVLVLNYALNNIGNVLNGYVYNLNGMLVDHSFNSISLATKGALFWDGIKSNGEKLAIGNYVLYVEVFNVNGKVEKKKLAFSVTGIF